MTRRNTGKRANWDALGLASAGLAPDWITVTEVTEGNPSAWVAFRAYWCPATRYYNLRGGAGGAGQAWADLIKSPADFRTYGKRDDVTAALEAWETAVWAYRPGPILDALWDIRTFRQNADYTGARLAEAHA